MTCPDCLRPGRVNYFCVDCCVRLLLTLPTREQRAAHFGSIERVAGYEHGEAVRAAVLKEWEDRKK